MSQGGNLHCQLEETVRSSIHGLYERILDDEVFSSLKDCQESRDYIVLRIEQMVRDTVGADRRQTLERAIEESTECKEELERFRSSFEQAQQQVQQWRSTAEVLRLENDRLKFEVVGCGQHAEQQTKRLKEELQQAKDAVNEARLKMEKAQAEALVLAHNLRERDQTIDQLTRKNCWRLETKQTGVGNSETGAKDQPKSPMQGDPLQKRLQRSQVIDSTREKPRDAPNNTNTHSVKELRLKQDVSDIIDEMGRASEDSRQVLQDELMEYAKEIERLKKLLAEEQSKSASNMAFMKSEFEKVKNEVKDYRKLKESDEQVKTENDRLHEQVTKFLVEREGTAKVQHTLERQLAQCKQLLNGESERVQQMDTEMVRLNKMNRNLEGELRELKERLQEIEEIKAEHIDQLREQLRQAELKLHLKDQSAYKLETEFSKVRKGASIELQEMIKENERLSAELSKQKEQSTRKIAEIDRLNRDLKTMYQRKIELMTSTNKEEHEKLQKHRSEARLYKDQAKEFKTKTERMQQEVKILEEKLIHLTKTNSGLEKESRTARNDCRTLEKTVKEQQAKITVLSETLKQANHKLFTIKPKLKDLQKKLFALDAHCEDTKFKLIEGGNMIQMQNQQTVADVLRQLSNKLAGWTKDTSEGTKLLQQQLNSTKMEQRRSQVQQSEYLRLIQQLQERLASKQLRDSEELGNLEKQVADLQRLCRKLQDTNNDNLRQIEYLQKIRHQQRLERQFKSPSRQECQVSVIPTIQHLPSKEYRERREFNDHRELGSMVSSNTIVNNREVEELQRHYDKLIRTLEDQNIKLRSETTRAEILFEKELAKLNDMYRSREKLVPHSVQELPTYEDKLSARERKERSQSRHILLHDLQKTRQKAPSANSDRYLVLDRPKKNGGTLTSDIKRDIEHQKRRLEQNRKNLGSYGNL